MCQFLICLPHFFFLLRCCADLLRRAISTSRWRHISTRPSPFPAGNSAINVVCSVDLWPGLLVLRWCTTTNVTLHSNRWHKRLHTYNVSWEYSVEAAKGRNFQALQREENVVPTTAPGQMAAFWIGSSWASGKGCSAGAELNECTHFHMTLCTTEAPQRRLHRLCCDVGGGNGVRLSSPCNTGNRGEEIQ